MVLDSQVQNPLDLQVQHALNAKALHGRPLFSSGGQYSSAPSVRCMESLEKELPNDCFGITPALFLCELIQPLVEPGGQLF